MAYLRKGYVKITANGRELIIDELDEDAISIEALGDKTTRRSTTRGKGIYSIMGDVPYKLTFTIPSTSKAMKRVLSYLEFLKSNDYPSLNFETHEKIDGEEVITYYEDGNVMTELSAEGMLTADAPKNTFAIAGTRTEKKI
ncbi:hypothetical protein EII29_08290 [Leptotrichia sp. OH3620_COT-345]|uniref:hypothetical protein n=1 Tax=Leptotrichia sp. OH3620_COT-345 TaxID=2491048 RepID=UPI000F654529|nr:hypothetical protein [Leptotrichia sp. OH3620_COT-345]RRD39105.1 hypothetical protein EII29_08290 [Leptotrichia sp. OH3620_COT-345]